MKYIISRYNHDLEWIKEYTNDYVLYDRSEKPLENSIVVPNLGSDISDKLGFMVDNYDNLPAVAVYCKANLFKYITKEEFDLVKDNQTFTPLFTKNHKVYYPICGYDKEGLYCEVNNYWYLNEHPAKNADKIIDLFQMGIRPYNVFAPGSNYILTASDIRKHPKSLYQTLKSYLDWDVYPGDAQLIERNLYYLWS